MVGCFIALWILCNLSTLSIWALHCVAWKQIWLSEEVQSWGTKSPNHNIINEWMTCSMTQVGCSKETSDTVSSLNAGANELPLKRECQWSRGESLNELAWMLQEGQVCIQTVSMFSQARLRRREDGLFNLLICSGEWAELSARFWRCSAGHWHLNPTTMWRKLFFFF